MDLLGIRADAAKVEVPAEIVLVNELGPVFRPASSEYCFAPTVPRWWQWEWKRLAERIRDGQFWEAQGGDPTCLRRLPLEEALTRMAPEIYKDVSYPLHVELPAIADWIQDQWIAGTMCLDDAPAELAHLAGWKVHVENLRANGRFVNRSKRGRPKSTGSEHTLAILSQARCFRLNNPNVTRVDAIERSLAILGPSDKDRILNSDSSDLVERYEREWNRFDIEGKRGPFFSF